MSYTRVSEIVRKCVEDLVGAGVSREVAERHVAPLELASVESIMHSHRDQLLLDPSIRTADLAERFGVDERTIRKWRKSALERNARAGTCSAEFA
jgi:hypothetical protein